jgi:hypothetical protein
VGHYSETASLNSKIEKVRLDRDLGRYSPKIVYVLSGGAATGFCHLGRYSRCAAEEIARDTLRGLIGAYF